MIYKTYELVCQLPADAALERIEALLSKESVKYRTTNLSVTSTQTPIGRWVEPRGWKPSTWVGVNPFRSVSGVDVRCEPGDDGLTKVVVRINRFRAFLTVASWVTVSFVAAFNMPEPGGAIFFVGSACAAWFVIVSFLGGYLIKKEIGDHLKDGKPGR